MALPRTPGLTGKVAQLEAAVGREMVRIEGKISPSGIEFSPEAPTFGQIMRYDGFWWAPHTRVPDIVISPAPSVDGQILVWDQTNSVWAPSNPSPPDIMPWLSCYTTNAFRLHPPSPEGVLRVTLSDGAQYTRTFTSPEYIELDNTDIDTGSVSPSTWYAVWMVLDAGVLTGVLSTSFAAPSGYDEYRYIGAIRERSAGGFRSFVQTGHEDFYFADAVSPSSLGTGTHSGTFISGSGYVPPTSHGGYYLMSADVAGGASGGDFTFALRSSNWISGTPSMSFTYHIPASVDVAVYETIWLPFRNTGTASHVGVNYDSTVTSTVTINSQDVKIVAYKDGLRALY